VAATADGGADRVGGLFRHVRQRRPQPAAGPRDLSEGTLKPFSRMCVCPVCVWRIAMK
jgi:hypothetical protein